MTDRLTVALAQINPTVGDLAGNAALIKKAYAEASAKGADLVLAPELALSGYPPEDLARNPAFLAAIKTTAGEIARITAKSHTGLILGAPWQEEGRVLNAALLLEEGAIKAVRGKHELPNYGPFDEKRVFDAAAPAEIMSFRGHRLGVMVCEDSWFQTVAARQAAAGAEAFLILNGSPFDVTKGQERERVIKARAHEARRPILYVNLVGGQDELVFDGASFALDENGLAVARAPSFEESIVFCTLKKTRAGLSLVPAARADTPEENAAIYSALLLGLRDYLRKNRFTAVTLGLSGGIDSALVAALAVDAVGPDRVRAVRLPSPFTSRESMEDAEEIARRLGLKLTTIEIAPMMHRMAESLTPSFGAAPQGLTAENLQSRLRGLTLMALSNHFGDLVLSTGNKSEMAVGYATLYGDMCGGFAPLKDLYKMRVYALAHWRNRNQAALGLGPANEVIPPRVLQKPPTAELRENQKDEDSLPPYPMLDAILEALIEQERPVPEIVARTGFAEETVRRVANLLRAAEHKRRQAPPGPKITARSFGRDRRYPITQHFKE